MYKRQQIPTTNGRHGPPPQLTAGVGQTDQRQVYTGPRNRRPEAMDIHSLTKITWLASDRGGELNTQHTIDVRRYDQPDSRLKSTFETVIATDERKRAHNGYPTTRSRRRLIRHDTNETRRHLHRHPHVDIERCEYSRPPRHP